ncbi:exportin-2-like [Tubulanus polymorphus]|uniref:exportin-2-like n=1 Tax=Tubulanus polymorphus TaxID=672921 RepID=UPI003DA1CD48
MDFNEANLLVLVDYLGKTLSPNLEERKSAEKFLESVEGYKNYPLLLLELLSKDGLEDVIRVSAAVMFKNYTKRNWRVVEDSLDKIHADDRAIIKERIVDLMLKSPEKIQRQLSDAISIIGREDFPKDWPNLIGEMVTKFQSGDFHMINGVLRTAHSIFKRYRHEFKSQELWTEIKFVLDNFAAPLTILFEATMQLAQTNANDPSALKVIFSSLVLICKIFYSLNFQDLPEHFEDNMDKWMTHFLALLTVDYQLLKTEDEDEAGLLEQVRSQVCDNVGLYTQKYDEEFSPHLKKFVEAVWHLLVNTGPQPKYDLLVSNAIQFLASVADRPRNKELFASPDTLQGICEKVIVPNMNFRKADGELFEDNPDEYIRKDMEGSDVDTRRRSACDLVKSLSKLFEGPVIEIFSKYVKQLLDEYSQNPAENWAKKDAAIYLVTSLAAKAKTQKLGITQTSELVNITDFFNSHIVPDLTSPNVDDLPVLKADAMKYVMIFRNQLSTDILIASVPLLVKHLPAKSHVVHSYAAYALERLLTVKGAHGGPAVSKQTILDGNIKELLQNLFSVMDQSGSEENEYAMKALMRTFSLLQESVLPYVSIIMENLAQKLIVVSKNPSKPHFNHYLFESLCVVIRSTCKVQPTAVSTFEGVLFSSFEKIIQEDVQEFIPYVFQIMSLLLEMHCVGVPDVYMTIFPFLLTPDLWERLGNIPPLVRLLQAFIEKGANQIPADKVSGLLGVFQKLLASKSNDHEGFYLINAMIEHLPQNIMGQYLKQVFILLFKRLMGSKTTKFVKSLIVFFCLYSITYGGSSLIEMIDGIQENFFGTVIEKVLISDVQKISGRIEKKICAVGLTKILTEAPVMLQSYDKFWAPLLQTLIGLFELPEDTTIPDDEHFIEIEDTSGYQTSYSRLMFAGKSERDPCHAVADMKLNLAKSLEKLSIGNPGKLQPLISSSLQPEAFNFLQHYLNAASVTLA